MRKEKKVSCTSDEKISFAEINCKIKSEHVSRKFIDKKTETGCVSEYSSRANWFAKRMVKNAFTTELNRE